jgi:uncharacterized membrane protein
VTAIKQQTIQSQRSSPSSRGSLVAVWCLILIFVFTFSTLSLRRHAALGTNGLDLGNVNQALWNTAHGDFLAFTNMAPIRSRLALHVEPILLLFVPFYWVGLGGPKLLLIVQAIVVGLGALPLYWLARDTFSAQPATDSIDRTVLPIVFPLAYLLLPALEAAVMYDFHAVTLAPTFLLYAFYYSPLGSYPFGKRAHVGRKRDHRWLFGLFVVLALACKEDMGLTVAMLGLYMMIARRAWRWGSVTIWAGLTWFAVAVFLIQPQFSPTGSNIQVDRYAWLGNTPFAIISNLLRRPGLVWEHLWQQANVVGYLSGLLLPAAFLPLLSPLAWLPALPSLAINLLSDNPFTWRLEDFHYAAPIAPFVFIAAIRGLGHLSAWAGRRSHLMRRGILVIGCGLVLVASLVYHYARGFSPLAWSFQPWAITDHHRRSTAVFSQIPPSASLFAQSDLNPHVSSRRVLYQDPALLSDPELANELPPPDYLLFDVSSLTNQNDFHRFIASELLEGGAFGPILAEDGYLLLQKGAAPQPLPDQFFDFARAGPDPDVITYPLIADFGDAVRLHGFNLSFNRAEEVQAVLYFEALDQLDGDYFLALYLLDRWGAPLGATLEDQPAVVWYPTSRWKTGELVKVTFNTVPWYTRDLSGYRLALGMMRGHDPWQPSARLFPTLQADDNLPYAVRLPEGGTLLELARFRQVSTLGVPRGMPAGGPIEREFRHHRLPTVLDVSLGGEVRLLGYDMAPVECKALFTGGGIDNCWLELVLYWQAQQEMLANYTVFVHVVGPDGQILGQRDAPPDGGAYPTQRWAAGEVVADPMRVPLATDLPAGRLEVMVGMYRPDTGQRLPVLDDQGQPVDDKVLLEGVVVGNTDR